MSKNDVAVGALLDLIEGTLVQMHPMSLTRLSVSPGQFDLLLQSCMERGYEFVPSRSGGLRRMTVHGIHVEEHAP